jgi:hypothetical protein
LTPKINELKGVTVQPYEKNGWEKWGKFFLDNFIGTSSFASGCKIKNSDIILFRNSKSSYELTAYAFEPLIIENPALGYTIRYELENFIYNYKTEHITYKGYTFFQAMSGNPSKQNRWEAKREDVYYGSMLHFMRALFRNRVAEEGFELRLVKKTVNEEKKRIREIYKNALSNKPSKHISGLKHLPKDSIEYYQKILHQKDHLDSIGALVQADNIAFASDSNTAELIFNDYLQVKFQHKETPVAYAQKYSVQSRSMISQIHLLDSQSVLIKFNGSYYDPTNLLSLGYWAWSEKISTMLPFDYWPPK